MFDSLVFLGECVCLLDSEAEHIRSFLLPNLSVVNIIRITALWEYENKKYVQGHWYLSNCGLPHWKEDDPKLDPSREVIASEVQCEVRLSKVKRKCFVLTPKQWLVHMSTPSSTAFPNEDVYWCVRFQRDDGELSTLPISRKRKISDLGPESGCNHKKLQSEYADCVVAHTTQPDQYFVRWLVSSPSLQAWQDSHSIDSTLLSRFQRNTRTHVTLPLRLLLSGLSSPLKVCHLFIRCPLSCLTHTLSLSLSSFLNFFV